MTKITYEALTPETMTALRSYASYAGRTWKSQLLEAWEKASMPGLLHQLRNSHGPSWLISFRLPKELSKAELAYVEKQASQEAQERAEERIAVAEMEAKVEATLPPVTPEQKAANKQAYLEGMLEAAAEAQTAYWEAVRELEVALGVDIDDGLDLSNQTVESLMGEDEDDDDDDFPASCEACGNLENLCICESPK